MDRLAEGRVERFSAASRAIHWVLALPFLVLLVSGLLLFQPDVKAIHLGGHRLVALAHVVAGMVLLAAIPVAAGLAVAARKARRDASEALRPRREDLAWARWAATNLSGGRAPLPPQPKFNLGQKLNVIGSTILTAGLAATGFVLGVNYFTKEVFATSFVESVFPWHDALTFAAIPIVLGHVYLSVIHPSSRASLSGIVRGHVDRSWASRHHGRWVEEMTGGEQGEEPAKRAAAI